MNKFFYLFFILLLFLWFIMSASRLGYNYLRVFSEEYKLLFLSDSELRQKVYGDIYPLFIWVDSRVSEKSTIFLISNDGKPYFYGRYFLYPKKIYWNKNDVDKNKLSQSLHDHVLIYHPKNNIVAELQGKYNQKLNVFRDSKKNIVAVLYDIK